MIVKNSLLNLPITLGVLGGFALIGVNPVQAITMEFSDRTLWENNITSPITTEDFNALTPVDPLAVGANNLGQITLTITGSNFNYELNDGTGGIDVDGSNYVEANPNLGISTFTITFPEPVTAWGADFTSIAGTAGGRVEVTFADVVGRQLRQVAGAGGFAGWTFDNGITTVSFASNNSNDIFGIDNVSFAPVPFEFEASLGLIVLGCIWAGDRYLKRKKSKIKA